ncbi:choice-of-anchor A family protein [Azohydromonas australica]|uniref:choice-of-anchor A family protein n=1 Tax=Azohydromonas australica TaxID=364039 RepID=UPI0004272512|nr:choice-of-anchor A family protein [Azohydromonas australica]
MSFTSTSRFVPTLGSWLKAPACAAALAVAGVLAVPASAQAAAVSLGVAGNFNVFALGNFTSMYSDTEGAVAVQGNATLTGYSVNLHNQAGYAGQSLVVGGNLSFSGGSIDHGNAYVGGTASTSNLGFGGTLQNGGAAPFSFAAAAQQLGTLSQDLAGVAASGKVDMNPWGGVSFTGDGSSATQIFEIDGADLLSRNSISLLNLSRGQTLIFNIYGEQAGFRNVGLDGFRDYNVLFNFVDATDLVLKSVGVFGSILAPNATISGGWDGQINGNVVVKNWNSNIQINNNHLFTTAEVALPQAEPAPAPTTGPDTGSTYEPIGMPSHDVPEPGTLALLLPALGWLAFSSRRRRTVGTAVGA